MIRHATASNPSIEADMSPNDPTSPEQDEPIQDIPGATDVDPQDAENVTGGTDGRDFVVWQKSGLGSANALPSAQAPRLSP
jgi:hypothetical protein